MESILDNTAFVFWAAITLMVLVPSLSGLVVSYWYKLRKAELDTQLKHQMLELGMSAGDIERVLRAGSESPDDADSEDEHEL